jgi:hypothetical protein
MASRDGELGARRIVLAQPADALEQPAAGGVVEILGRKRLAGPGEPLQNVVGEAGIR